MSARVDISKLTLMDTLDLANLIEVKAIAIIAKLSPSAAINLEDEDAE